MPYLKECQLPQLKDAPETFITMNERSKGVLCIGSADLNGIRYLYKLYTGTCCVLRIACVRACVRA